MSVDEFRDQLDTALASAIAGDADLGEVDQALEDARGRIDEIRTARGEA
ncbi:hypothetical protein [Natrinema sp. DC36]|nr:hypothetical protein [Natrinema sp. DC36]